MGEEVGTEEKVIRRVPISNAELNPPSNTLYLNNLPEKIKLPELKKIISMLFGPFGEILAIHARRSVSMRGQAFIVYANIEDAEKALEEMQSFPLFYKPICINFSKFKSHQLSKLDGSFDSVKADQDRYKAEKALKPRVSRRQYMQPSSGPGAPVMARVPSGEVPNKVLFLVELPSDVTGDLIKTLFQPYAGFREVRLVPGKSDIAFVEFENETQSTLAKNALDKYQITENHQLKVLYARK